MIDLYYPTDNVPLFPRPSVDHPGKAVPGSAEMLPLVTPDGVVFGRASREWCHGGSRELHPVVHLFIADREGNVLLQKRASWKETYPGAWDMSAGGHVTFGESALETVYREAEEELGLVGFTPLYLFSRLDERETERELSVAYAVIGRPALGNWGSEVEQCRWWSIPEIEAQMGKGVFTPVFEAEWPLVKEKLASLL